MSNPTELLKSRYGEIPFNPEIVWNESLTTLSRSKRSREAEITPGGGVASGNL
ncbi:hypothetical protein [Anabaena azotica]|uniref:Uncharacterized protein n=1 Tax=Anabaena azotica FACHB-119 TaxID=947527 RepID=A0ABR8D1H1_9NOST|nr:hypothetical protein [Anabaena azotica]MBD2500090.1 hypothetical protein [Anabaena azotica FACHB-119]